MYSLVTIVLKLIIFYLVRFISAFFYHYYYAASPVHDKTKLLQTTTHTFHSYWTKTKQRNNNNKLCWKLHHPTRLVFLCLPIMANKQRNFFIREKFEWNTTVMLLNKCIFLFSYNLNHLVACIFNRNDSVQNYAESLLVSLPISDSTFFSCQSFENAFFLFCESMNSFPLI